MNSLWAWLIGAVAMQIVAAVASQILGEETAHLGMSLARSLVHLSARILPRRVGKRYREEWLSVLDDRPTTLRKVTFAMSIVWGALRIRRNYRRPHSLSIDAAFTRTVDILGAAILFVTFAPLIGTIFFVMRKSGTSPIFRHLRVGRNGELFECLKFRTMVPNAEHVLRDLLASDHALREEWDRDHRLRDDPRVTRLGRFLRNTSLDELPQIWNVLKGEMSLVGPRPVTRAEIRRYGRNRQFYKMVKPGITGLWQVSGRSTTDYRRRVAIDVCYVRNRSPLLDLWILLKTTLIVLGRRGAY